VDASNRPLLAFYRRQGFEVSPPFAFFGHPAARVEYRRPTAREDIPC
jgi:ribosomal protein S18 acetylase RimI-like enzyme